jgi:hypothetical protein
VDATPNHTATTAERGRESAKHRRRRDIDAGVCDGMGLDTRRQETLEPSGAEFVLHNS